MYTYILHVTNTTYRETLIEYLKCSNIVMNFKPDECLNVHCILATGVLLPLVGFGRFSSMGTYKWLVKNLPVNPLQCIRISQLSREEGDISIEAKNTLASRSRLMFSSVRYSWTGFWRGAFDFLLLHEFTIDRRKCADEACACHCLRNSAKYRKLQCSFHRFRYELQGLT